MKRKKLGFLYSIPSLFVSFTSKKITNMIIMNVIRLPVKCPILKGPTVISSHATPA